MCPTFQETNTQNVRVWSKERFVDIEGVSGEVGDLVVPQIRLAQWMGLKVFKGLGEQVCGSAVGVSFNRRILELDHL